MIIVRLEDVLWTTVVHNDMRTREQFLQLTTGLGLALALGLFFGVFV